MAIKPSSHGIVVEHKETGLRYASRDENYDPSYERKVRDLDIGETIMSYGVKSPVDYSAADTAPEQGVAKTSGDPVGDTNAGDGKK